MVRLRVHEHEQRNLLDDTQSVCAYPAAGGAESFEYIHVINYTLFITVKFYWYPSAVLGSKKKQARGEPTHTSDSVLGRTHTSDFGHSRHQREPKVGPNANGCRLYGRK